MTAYCGCYGDGAHVAATACRAPGTRRFYHVTVVVLADCLLFVCRLRHRCYDDGAVYFVHGNHRVDAANYDLVTHAHVPHSRDAD